MKCKSKEKQGKLLEVKGRCWNKKAEERIEQIKTLHIDALLTISTKIYCGLYIFALFFAL